MALAIDGSSPALASRDDASDTLDTASFTPPAGSELWVASAANNSTAGGTFTITSTGLTFTQRMITTVQEVPVAWHTAPVSVSQAYVVRTVRSGATLSNGMSTLVRVITGQETTPSGATATNNSSSGTVSQTITTTRANSLILAASADWSQSGLATYGANQTNLAEHNLSSQYTSHFWRRDGLVAAGTYTINQTAPTPQDYNLAVVEIRDSTDAALPYSTIVGTPAAGIADITVDWPAGHAAGDIGLLFIESTGGQAAALGTANGFVAVTGSPSNTGTGTAGTRVTCYWCRATSGAMASPVVTDPGNHAYGVIVAVRGVKPLGDPWETTQASQKASATGAFAATGVTTTIRNDVIVAAVAHDLDGQGANQIYSGWANANITGLAEIFDGSTDQGNGGGLGIAVGQQNGNGATGDITGSVTSSINAMFVVALPLAYIGSSSLTSRYIYKPAVHRAANW